MRRGVGRMGAGLVLLLMACGAQAQALTAVTCAPAGLRVTACVFDAGEMLPMPALHQRPGQRTFDLTGVRLAPGFAVGALALPITAVRVVQAGDTVRVDVQVDGAPDTALELDARGLRLVLRAAEGPAASEAPASALPASGVPAFFSTGRWALDHIVVDAGHGGHDIGASYFGVREKDVTLGIARRVGRMLEDELGLRVTYTRDRDVFVPLAERGHLANAAGGKLFVSIHANSMPRGVRARGTETYFLGLHKTASAQSVMERENSVVRLEADPDAYAAYSSEQAVVQALAGSAYLRTSERLAALVEEAFGQHGRASRGVKQAGFYVLWSASMPAILVETGFLTDPVEARMLASADGQEEVARRIVDAVRALKVQYDRALVPGQ